MSSSLNLDQGQLTNFLTNLNPNLAFLFSSGTWTVLLPPDPILETVLQNPKIIPGLANVVKGYIFQGELPTSSKTVTTLSDQKLQIVVKSDGTYAGAGLDAPKINTTPKLSFDNITFYQLESVLPFGPSSSDNQPTVSVSGFPLERLPTFMYRPPVEGLQSSYSQGRQVQPVQPVIINEGSSWSWLFWLLIIIIIIVVIVYYYRKNNRSFGHNASNLSNGSITYF